ncbi:RAD9, HUS1, RAD1-interacting nuclear orphan protein 1 [Carassius gibelio]|uniref:RAD9, HUS1, RAD1-interacting nuclear orphan protein 1 n=1 Tax=Carassius gibelio TaxID=101364 RepID=UPI0022787C62|nr:RAD9, HUS1, RAD1-interacting nuclear orphan protein 1 [Carassius gibelio]XP_052410062.1 RAD9, HUS1, RAD1-interacting nuclear orphan protein 1 [Carassius gibelio]
MPRNSHKKRLLKPNKSQLLFVEAPINGPKHEYGPQLRSAIHPKSFISEKQQRSGAPCTSWVSPQFNSLKTTTLSRDGRGRRNNQMATRISNKAPVLGFCHTKRAKACKYIPLSFEATPAGSQHQCENIRSSRTKNDRLASSDSHSKDLRETPRRTCFPRKGVERRMATHVISTSRHSEVSKNVQLHKNGMTGDSVHTPNTSLVPKPLNIETPEMPHCSSTPPSNVQHLLFPQNQARTPPRTENSSILVMDTPEKDYGLKVTWRRRKGLMKLLIDRGQLLPADAGVVSDWT